MAVSAAGTEPGQRRLNGPQTTGRSYRNLSPPAYGIIEEFDTEIVVRDGTVLLADVLRPDAPEPVPALVAASCYPREIQNSGAPLGFVEAGASDFWVPRGYGHVIVDVRGTGGSGGTYTMLGPEEQRDLADVVEWVAGQPWCDGNVGMIGISYFGMTQLAAAGHCPPHLKAIFPGAATAELYEAIWHHGVLSSTFASAWLAGVGILAGKKEHLFRNRVVDVVEEVLKSPAVHQRFEHLNGEAAVSALGAVMRASYPSDPFDRLWTEAVSRPVRDGWWQDRNLAEAARRISVPVYLFCDWENVPLHLPSTFTLWESLEGRVPLRMGLLGKNGLTWPWESMHVEALAWFDHWLKGVDTGVLDGPPVRYWMPGAEEFRTAETWPPPDATIIDYALRSDGTLAPTDPSPGERRYLFVPDGAERPRGAPEPVLPSMLAWESPPLANALDVVGEMELVLDARISALDTHWLVTLQDVDEDDQAEDVTAGWLRASLRAVDEEASRPGRPVLALTSAEPVPSNSLVTYRIPLVPNARRFARHHRIRLTLTSDDRGGTAPAMMGFRHAPPADASVNTVASSSRLRLPATSSSGHPASG
ncbi:CocE/NonD family hydrolase [Rhabdothermincola sediminis]|uniref:CocE/NonD family hydrolase n=1 Tax=Rhabdothermincola sediminis TaxID=2751370 RepID=UPI001AA0A36B|nr:CocE/NonD family hydrolase [Rhabdothermincola sediminis]